MSASNGVEWRHYKALLDHGVPSRYLVGDGRLKFRVVHRYGREFIVTDSPIIRAYFDEVVLPVAVDTPP